MRYPQTRIEPVQSEVVIMTGGIKEDVSQLELKPGNLLSCQNYEEIDGIFHGYTSIKGYERFDGQPIASGVDVLYLLDYGKDSRTTLLLESDIQDPILDESNYSQTVTNNGVVNDNLHKKFGRSSFHWNAGTNLTVTPVDNGLDLTHGLPRLVEDLPDNPGEFIDNPLFRENFTIDWLMGYGTFTETKYLFEKGMSYRVYTDASGHLVFEYSLDGLAWETPLISDTTLTSSETHVSVFRKADTIYMSFNGVIDDNSLSVGEDLIFAVADDLVIGSNYIGKMDEIRFSTTYRWLFNFEIPLIEYSYSKYYFYQVDDEDREAARLLIQPVPGSGPILGIANNQGNIGAVRNNEAGTKSFIYRADPTGWSTAIPGVWFLEFENGTDTDAEYVGPLAGSFIRGSVSGATAKIVDIVTRTGSWQDLPIHRDAAGLMVLKDIVGAFVDTDLLTIEDPLGTPLTMTCDVVDGSYAEYALDPDGNYEFINARWATLPDLQRELVPFFVNGVNWPIYYDGTQLIPILDDKLPDASGVFANHIIQFKNRLFLAYPDGRLWYSEVNDPLGWDTGLGAGEIYMEDEITGMEVTPGDALIIYCRNSIQIIKSIYDSNLDRESSADYAFFKESFSQRSGAISGTSQRLLGEMYFLDDRGLTAMSTVDTFGDFGHNSVSKNVAKTLTEKRALTTVSLVQRESNQYRLFFSDNTGLYFTFDQEKKIKGITQVHYKHQVRVATEGENPDGTILMVFGSEEDQYGDAYVYRMDSGTSFDGEVIETKLTTAFYSYRSPTNWKRFHKITMETQAEKGLLFHGRPDFNYRDPNLPRSLEGIYESIGLGGFWGQDAWGAFTYGSGEVVTPILYLTGYGNNMSMTIATEDKYRGQHIINSLIIEYSKEGRKM